MFGVYYLVEQERSGEFPQQITCHDALEVEDVPAPEPRPGWVRIKVKAFGVNESEVSTRKGESAPEVIYPRIPVPVAKVYRGLQQVRDAQADVESGATPGKHVVLLTEAIAS